MKEESKRPDSVRGAGQAPKIKADECLRISVHCRDAAERALLFARLTDEGYRCLMA